jgi:hypothetical protein
MDLWLIKEPEIAETDINILGATGSTVDGSPVKKRMGQKISNDFLVPSCL